MDLKADVVIPVYNHPAMARDCIESVFECSGSALGQVIVINDNSPDTEIAPMLRKLRTERPGMILLEHGQNLGFIMTANDGIALRKRDVVLFNSDAIATSGWLSEMLEVAYSSDRICAVSPLSNNATICSIPEFCRPTPAEKVKDVRFLGTHGLPRYTQMPTGVGFCFLMKHTVVNMIGAFDTAYGRAYNEENDWAMRAQRLGFISVRANWAFVYHLGRASYGPEQQTLEARNAALLSSRHPSYMAQVQRFCCSPEAYVAAHSAQRQLGKLRVGIDASAVPPGIMNGTIMYAVELAKSLKKRTDLDVTVTVDNPAQQDSLASLGTETRLRQDAPHQMNILHRPAQIYSMDVLTDFLNSTAHTVISYLDLILYRTPSLFHSEQAYEQYRAISYASLHSAQAIIAISEHNRKELIREFHLDDDHVHAVHLGVDLPYFSDRRETRNISLLDKHGVRGPYFLCVGADLPHKNLSLLLSGYALFRSLYRIQTRYKRQESIPQLILTGHSISLEQGGLCAERRSQWPAGVRHLGLVERSELRALYQEAVSFIFPSAYEGFGLPPLEAMAAGVPVICSSLTSLPEVVGEAAVMIRDFSSQEIGGLMLQVCRRADLRERLITAGRGRVKLFSWEETARKTAELYLGLADRPPMKTMMARRMTASLLAIGGGNRKATFGELVKVIRSLLPGLSR